MKVVNIVPVGMLEMARIRMVSAADWSLRRWNEEGSVEEEEGRDDVDSIIQRETRSKCPNDTYEGGGGRGGGARCAR